MSAANVAGCEGTDCAYYNLANISFLDPNSQYIESGLIYIHLPKISFKGENNLLGQKVDAIASTKVENVAVPYFHYVSKAFGNWRYSP